MKVKLLKKIRKRYTITHFPNGVFISNTFYNGPITILEDNLDDWRFKTSSQDSAKEAYKELYIKLIQWIQTDYGPFNSKKRKITAEKLWYKK